MNISCFKEAQVRFLIIFPHLESKAQGRPVPALVVTVFHHWWLSKVKAHLKRHIVYHNTAFFTKRYWEKGVILGWRNLDNIAKVANSNQAHLLTPEGNVKGSSLGS